MLGKARSIGGRLAEVAFGYYTRAAEWRIIRREAKYESSHRFSGGGFGGGRDYHGPWSVFTGDHTAHEEGDQARRRSHTSTIQRRHLIGQYALPGGADWD